MPKCSPMAYRMLLHGASDLDQRCPKSRRSAVVAFLGGSHQISQPYPKIAPKPLFGGPFNAKPIIERALRKSHVNGATKLKLYSYMYRQVLGVCQNFSAREHPGDAGPLNVNLGPPLSRKLLELES